MLRTFLDYVCLALMITRSGRIYMKSGHIPAEMPGWRLLHGLQTGIWPARQCDRWKTAAVRVPTPAAAVGTGLRLPPRAAALLQGRLLARCPAATGQPAAAVACPGLQSMVRICNDHNHMHASHSNTCMPPLCPG